MPLLPSLAQAVGLRAACQALGLPRSSVYRWRQPRTVSAPPARPRKPSPRALSEQERQRALAVLNSPRFVDASPAQVYATLLDEGTYLCSLRTFYRLLQLNDQVRERRNQLRHPVYRKPELLAQGPNQVWSWDITKLRGPLKGLHYCLYVVLDIFSRRVVGWLLAERESHLLAQKLLRDSLHKHRVPPGQLILHADRGASMKSKPLALMLADLGVTKTHSRPHTSNDNPYSEAQLKTLKYHPRFPDRFGSLQDARAFCRFFFDWYNSQHRHSGLALMTPDDIHFGRASALLRQRQKTLHRAFLAHPERFRSRPRPRRPPDKVWINPPATPELNQGLQIP